MRGRSSSPGPLLRHGSGSGHKHRGEGDDEGRRSHHRRRSHSREGPSRRHHSRHRGRGHSHSHSRSRSRSVSPGRARSPKHRSPSRSRSPRRRRKESPSSSNHHHRKRRRSRSASSSSSSSSSDKEDGRKRHRSHHKKHKHKSKRSSHSRERKERKRAKKEKKKGKGAVTSQWGQYGIINDADLYNKEEEFRAWLIEEKMVNRETLSKDQEKKLFAQFVEDFNTATLPHEKYYNMGKYDARMNMLRNGELLPQNNEYDPNADLQAHTASHKRAAVEHDTYLSKDQLEALRKVQNERIEAGKMKVLGLEVKNSMGVRMDGNAFEPGRR